MLVIWNQIVMSLSDNYLLQVMLFRFCTSPLSVIFDSLCVPRFQARLPLHRVPGCGRRAASPEDMRKPWVRSHQHQAEKSSATSVVFFLDFPCVFSYFIFIMGNLDFLCLFSGEIWCFKGYIGVAGYSKVSFTKSRSDFWYRWRPPQWKLRWQSQIDWRFVLLPSRPRAIRIILHNYA